MKIREHKRQIIIWVSMVAVLVGFFGLVAYGYRHDLVRNIQRASLPDAKPYLPVAGPVRTADGILSLPAEVNLDLPFTSQAPHANWDLPYKEFCEEASILMAMRYLNHQSITSPEDADAALLRIREFEEDYFGYYEDTDVADTATIIEKFFEYPNVQILENPTTNDIKSAVAQGKPVLVPAAGRLLGNPYFQSPGPLYHMVVVKGYTSDGRFIVHDPGTRRGEDFIYDPVTLLNALHDWRDDQQIERGRKAVIIVG